MIILTKLKELDSSMTLLDAPEENQKQELPKKIQVDKVAIFIVWLFTAAFLFSLLNKK